MKMRKIGCAVLALAMIGSVGLSAVGCGGGGSSKETVITVTNFNGGVGTKWFDRAAERFKELVAEKSYEEGKTGVKFDVTETMYINANNAKTDGTDIYFTQNSQNVMELANKGLLLDITDIVKEKKETDKNGNPISIEDKLMEDNMGFFKGDDGKYYGLPHYEIYSGLSYDVDTFDLYGLYFAAPNQENSKILPHPSDYGTGVFIKKGTDAKKSCGPDGVYDTVDDGLPSSLLELMILCDKMLLHNVQPIQLSGMYASTYSSHLNCGLWASLAGYEQMRSNYTFEGKVEVVTGYTDESLFDGIPYIKKPITKWVDMTEETGYKAYDMASRYYASAFVEIAEKEGWMSDDSYTATVSHTGAQSSFVFGGVNGTVRTGMMVEGSYWYNEAEDAGTFDDYLEYVNSFGGNPNRNLAWMALPVTFDTTVTEGNGRTSTFLDVGSTSCFINKNVEENPGLMNACKDFMQFLFSDEELSHFTEESGCAKPMKYELLEEDYDSLAPYFKSLWDVRKNSKVVLQYGENEIFRNHRADLLIYCDKEVCIPLGYRSFLTAIREGKTATEAFEGTRRTQAQWERFLNQ